MLRLPIFTFLRVQHFGLFSGRPVRSGLKRPFKDGPSVIAGVDGLGKTALVRMLLRCNA
jgi:hypothetical protein